jgi:hypothetical protein
MAASSAAARMRDVRDKGLSSFCRKSRVGRDRIVASRRTLPDLSGEKTAIFAAN